MNEPIDVRVDGHIAIVTMNRPVARNAIDRAMAEGLDRALDIIESDIAIRVAVLSAVGPVFCAGADLKEIAAGHSAELSTERGGFAGVCRRERSKPIVAAVDGPALAGGFEIVAACDLVVAGRAARFAIPEVKRGLVAGGGGLVQLPRKLPFNLAMETALTGDPITAERAYEVGFVNSLVESSALDEALRLARSIVANSPSAVRSTRDVLQRPADTAAREGWALSRSAFERAVASDDAREGTTAFFENREPVWRDR